MSKLGDNHSQDARPLLHAQAYIGRVDALLDLSARLGGARHLTDVLVDVITGCKYIVDCIGAALWVDLGDQPELIVQNFRGQSWLRPAGLGPGCTEPHPLPAHLAEVAEHRHPLQLKCSGTQASLTLPTSNLHEHARVREVIALPVPCGPTRLGVLAIYGRNAGQNQTDSLDLLNSLAQMLGFALARDFEQRELESSRSLVQRLLDTTEEAVFLRTPSGKIGYLNRRGANLLGSDTTDGSQPTSLDEDYILQSSQSYDDPTSYIAATRDYFAGTEGSDQVRRNDGRVLLRRALQIPGLGQVILVRDISQDERQRHELRNARDLAEANARRLSVTGRKLSEVLDHMADAMIATDLMGQVQMTNPAAEQIFGYSQHEFLGLAIQDLLPSDPHPSNREECWSAATRGATDRWHGQVRGRRKDGSGIDLNLSFTRIEVDGDAQIICTIHDLSHRKNAEKSAQRLQAIFSSVREGIALLSDEGVVEFANDAYLRCFAENQSTPVGRHALPLRQLDPDPAGELAQAMDTCRSWTGECRFRGTDDMLREFEIGVSPMDRDNGAQTQFVAVFRDVTERRQLERQLLQAQKLESIGQLAAGVAHEINTPLQFTTDNLRFLQNAFEDMDGLFALLEAGPSNAPTPDRTLLTKAMEDADLEFLREEIPASIAQTLEGLTRVATIVRSMKEFSHPSDDMQLADLRRCIDTTISVSTNEWKYLADMQVDHDPALPLIPCISSEINQVVLNMIVNATHAIEDVVGSEGQEKGTIRIQTAVLEDWAEIRISDSGSGMPDEVKHRIFDPFFTTKVVGKGTGQGLSIAHAVVVERHLGTIAVESGPGQGTTFIIRLPLSRPDLDMAAA